MKLYDLPNTAESSGNFSNDLDKWNTIQLRLLPYKFQKYRHFPRYRYGSNKSRLNEWKVYDAEEIKNFHGDQWRFWVDWYERALAGKPQDWDLVEKLVFQDDDFWDGNDYEVNERIKALVADHNQSKLNDTERAKQNSPNAEFVRVLNGRFVTETVIEIDKNFYEQAIERALDAIAEMHGIPVGDNIKGIFDAELERLAQYLERLSDKPLRIYEELMRIVVRVDEKIGYNGLADGRVDDFRTKLDNSALDILTHDDQVKSAVRARAAARFDRMTGPEQEHYLALMDYLAAHSEPGSGNRNARRCGDRHQS